MGPVYCPDCNCIFSLCDYEQYPVCQQIQKTPGRPGFHMRYLSDVDAVLFSQRPQTASKPLTNGFEFPFSTVAIEFAEDHRGLC